MDRSYRVWFLLALLLALAPAGARSLIWFAGGRPRPLDLNMAQAGEVLFKHDFKVKDPLCSEGDGIGPLFNATSCAACHHMGGVGGAGGLEHNVTTYTIRLGSQTPREGVIHARSLGRHETLQDVHATFPATSKPTLDQLVQLAGRSTNHCIQFPQGFHVSQRNTPALWGAKLIDEIPERVILAGAKAQRMKWGMATSEDETIPVGRALRLANGKIGRFGWKAQMASLSDFVQAACANELGLSNPGQAQPIPIYGLGNSRAPEGYDLTLKQCDQLTAFCASLPRPVEKLAKNTTEEQVSAGKKLFTTIGCAACHTPKLGDVDGIYSDLLLHRMGAELVGGGSYGEPPIPPPDRSSGDEGSGPSEWRTPPLWGVADSAPYLHDGRANTLEEAIRQHGGQAQRSATRFTALKPAEQAQLIAFLKSLRSPG